MPLFYVKNISLFNNQLSKPPLFVKVAYLSVANRGINSMISSILGNKDTVESHWGCVPIAPFGTSNSTRLFTHRRHAIKVRTLEVNWDKHLGAGFSFVNKRFKKS